MAAKYLVRIGDDTEGPYDLQGLRELWAQGELPPEALIADQDDGVFYDLASMDYLFEAPDRSAAPRAPAPPARASQPIQGARSPQPVQGARVRSPMQGVQVRRPASQRASAEPSSRSAPRKVTGIPSALTAGLVLGILGLVAMSVAFLRFDWALTAMRVTNEGGLEHGRELRIGPLYCELQLESPVMRLLGGTDRHIERIKTREFLRVWRLKDPNGFGTMSVEHGTQTFLASMAAAILGLFGCLWATVAGGISLSNKRPAKHSGGFVIACAVLTVVCLLAVALLGIAYGVQGNPEGQRGVGVGFFLAVVGAASCLAAGIALFRSSRSVAPRRGARGLATGARR